MNIKEKLTQLYKEASVYAREAYGKRNHIPDCCYATADDVIEYLIANGVTIAPAVPGPSEDDHNIMELCFHNGERHMKEKLISLLMEYKTQVNGACHAHIVDILEMVQDF